MTTTDWSAVKIGGPLAPYASEFFADLRSQGYAGASARSHLRLVAHMSRWLEDEGLEVRELTNECVIRYCAARRRLGYTAMLTPRAAEPLLAFLRTREVVPAMELPEILTSDEHLLAGYHEHLVHERCLVPDVVKRWDQWARLFVMEHPGLYGVGPAVTAADVSTFVARELPRRGKKLASAIRTFLRYLYLDGRTELPLANAVPAVANWSGASLPRWIAPSQVALLLDSCDRRTAGGRRAFAILLLLARLGLRAGEVADLGLEDVDWRAGELVVHGKGHTEERLPLPNDVGKALAGYLQRGRPIARSRKVFLREHAPVTGLEVSGIRYVVYRACERAGIPRIGAHQLRHSAATAMLRAGASLPEVGQVLRHRRLDTTAIYAKVDHIALRTIALPWPEGAA